MPPTLSDVGEPEDRHHGLSPEAVLREAVNEAVDGLDVKALTTAPEPGTNPIGWLVWHATRVQDHHIAEILDAEQGEFAPWARATAAELRKKSPTSLKVAFVQMQRGKGLDLAAALRLEYRLTSQIIANHDYAEGIAARIAGNGRAAVWQPARLEDVDDAWIESLFETPPTGELDLDEKTPGL